MYVGKTLFAQSWMFFRGRLFIASWLAMEAIIELAA